MKGSRLSVSCLVVLLLAWVGNPCAQTATQAPTAALSGTSWQLVKFQGSDDKTLTPADRAKYTVVFASDGSVSVRIDCNRGHGTWKSDGPNQLQFGPLALTRAMCPPALLNDRIPKDWTYVRSYILKNDHLFLSLMADGGTYEFEPFLPAGATAEKLKGTASYRERMALPPNAVFEAALEDVSKANAGPEVLGQARIENPGSPPIRFEIAYDPSRIAPSHRYAVRARILVDGKPFFTADQNYAVPTAGENNEIVLPLRREAAPEGEGAKTPAIPGRSSPTSLENTDWKLTHLGEAAVIVASEQREPYFVLSSESHRVSGSGGCNTLTGSYELEGDQLVFSQMASTMMACPEGMDTEKAFLRVLTEVKTWKIAEQQLELFDAGGNLLASFEAR
jgi:putative lipoprotein